MKSRFLPCHLIDMPELRGLVCAFDDIEKQLSVVTRRLALAQANGREHVAEALGDEKLELLRRKVAVSSEILSAGYRRVLGQDRHLNLV